MTALLLANAAATFFMVGLTWFVQIVHYPLFPNVGEGGFAEYHRLHSDRTTRVVLPPMAVELATSFLLLLDPPAGETALAAAGAVLALSTWVLTAFAASVHGEIGRQGLSSRPAPASACRKLGSHRGLDPPRRGCPRDALGSRRPRHLSRHAFLRTPLACPGLDRTGTDPRA